MLPRLRRGRELLRGAILLGAALATAPTHAQTPAQFYRNHTVTIIVGFSLGGGYDLYARTLARHIGSHIPGNPAVNVQNMPGAGSLKAANYLFNVAPKDGTVFGIFDRGLPMEKLLGRVEGENFDAARFTWIGSITDEPSVCGFSARSGIRNWHDMQTKPFTVGGAGITADDQIYPTVLKNLFHLPVRVSAAIPGVRKPCCRSGAAKSMASAAGHGPASSAATNSFMTAAKSSSHCNWAWKKLPACRICRCWATSPTIRSRKPH